jgi:ribosomal protein L40E
MEMFVMALVVIAAFIAVLMPLFRRRVGAGDAREFENVPAEQDPTGPAEEGADSAGGAAPAASSPAAAASPEGRTDPIDADDLELEVGRYRQALRAGTICRRCGQANPAGSRFCFECGAQLPLEEAREFK